jgi:hypothetical protein
MFTSVLATGASLLLTISITLHTASTVWAAPASQGHSIPLTLSAMHPQPRPCHGNCSWIHDPSILYDNGIYWRFSTSGNIAVATAPFLEGPWVYRGALLPNGTSIYLRDDQDIWVRHNSFLKTDHDISSLTIDRRPQ